MGKYDKWECDRFKEAHAWKIEMLTIYTPYGWSYDDLEAEKERITKGVDSKNAKILDEVVNDWAINACLQRGSEFKKKLNKLRRKWGMYDNKITWEEHEAKLKELEEKRKAELKRFLDDRLKNNSATKLLFES